MLRKTLFALAPRHLLGSKFSKHYLSALIYQVKVHPASHAYFDLVLNICTFNVGLEYLCDKSGTVTKTNIT